MKAAPHGYGTPQESGRWQVRRGKIAVQYLAPDGTVVGYASGDFEEIDADHAFTRWAVAQPWVLSFGSFSFEIPLGRKWQEPSGPTPIFRREH
jgi:hypothetical protein